MLLHAKSGCLSASKHPSVRTLSFRVCTTWTTPTLCFAACLFSLQLTGCVCRDLQALYSLVRLAGGAAIQAVPVQQDTCNHASILRVLRYQSSMLAIATVVSPTCCCLSKYSGTVARLVCIQKGSARHLMSMVLLSSPRQYSASAASMAPIMYV